MTVFDLEEKPGAWFDMDGGGRVQLKLLSGEQWRSIRAQTVKLSAEYQKLDGKWQRFEVEQRDAALEDKLFWDAVICDWSNLFDSKGVEIPCTAENKTLLMLTQPVFAKFVGQCIDVLTRDDAERAKASEKN